MLHIAFNSLYNWWGLSDLKYFHALFLCFYKVAYFNVWGWSTRPKLVASVDRVEVEFVGPPHLWVPTLSTLLLYGSYNLNLCDSIWFPVWLLRIMLWPFSVNQLIFICSAICSDDVNGCTQFHQPEMTQVNSCVTWIHPLTGNNNVAVSGNIMIRKKGTKNCFL
jgi:hypothetical protein